MNITERPDARGVPVFVWRGQEYASRELAEAARAAELKRRQDFRWMRRRIDLAARRLR